MRKLVVHAILFLALAGQLCHEAQAAQALGYPYRQLEQQIPILGIMIEADRIVGTVAHITVSFSERTDSTGLAVIFPRRAGKLSPMAQTSTEQAIYRAARAAGLSTDSWTVMVSVDQPKMTIHGNSLSAMVGLTVIALAKGQTILPGRVLTGGIAPDGHILTVGGLPLKVEAAGLAHFERVLVPDEISPDDGDWKTPFLMQVSPVSSLQQAYLGLTGKPLVP
ncbi:MAG: S16 family serine protease [Nitrospiraceae bacterium]